jgi:predicted DNA-binding transcriptional regulator AlpA
VKAVNPFESLPDVGGQRVGDITRALGISRQTFYNWVKSGHMPAPILIGPNVTIVPNKTLKEAFAARVKESA